MPVADQEAHRPAQESPVGPYRLRQRGVGLQRELGGLPVGREVVLAAQPEVVNARRVCPGRVDARDSVIFGHHGSLKRGLPPVLLPQTASLQPLCAHIAGSAKAAPRKPLPRRAGSALSRSHLSKNRSWCLTSAFTGGRCRKSVCACRRRTGFRSRDAVRLGREAVFRVRGPGRADAGRGSGGRWRQMMTTRATSSGTPGTRSTHHPRDGQRCFR